MAKREYIQRHLLIIKRLKNKPCTFEELKKYLLQQQELTEDNFDISKRTFQRDIKDIYTIYGTEIKNNKKEGWYEIVEEDLDKPFDRILEAFETMTALNVSKQISNKLILENKGTKGTEYMSGLLYAIENNYEITITHKSFWKVDEEVRILNPIAIKESKNRWYLICFDTVKEEFRNFGLDRIKNLDISNKKFKSHNYNASTYYEHAFGIETYKPAEKIKLTFDSFQAQYIKSLPLHNSQRVIYEDDEICTFEYFMHPTNDLHMEILKYGAEVTVEEPDWFKENIKESIQNMIRNYE